MNESRTEVERKWERGAEGICNRSFLIVAEDF